MAGAGGPFVGLYQGQSGAADASAALKPLLPNISVYQQGTSTAPPLQNQVSSPTQPASGGNLANFEKFLGGLAEQTGHLATEAGSWVATQIGHMATGIAHVGPDIGHGIVDNMVLNDQFKQNSQLSAQVKTLNSQFKSKQINSKQYQLGLKSISQSLGQLDLQSKAMINKVTFDQKASTQAAVDTASALITIATGGFGATGDAALQVGKSGVALQAVSAKSASDFLMSEVAKPILQPAIDTINRMAIQPEVYKLLDAATQEAFQRSTAEVVAQAGENMTAGQIGRATAANLALKYPLYFNYTSGVANQLYGELDQGKYGDAIRSLGFQGLLIGAGGVMGQALKSGGSLLRGAGNLTFGEGSFWDQLSTYYGDGSANGFAKAINKAATAISDTGKRVEFIKNLGAVEAINRAAVGGSPREAAAAAALRVADGMQGSYSTDLKSIMHDQAIQDMVNYAKNFRIAQQEADSKGLGFVAVGRLDARDKSAIADAVTQGGDPTSRLQAWEDWKATNPNLAAANNGNFDLQIKNLISSTQDEGELTAAIKNIKAGVTIKGFSQGVVDKLAADGYVPIQPKHLAAPFKEGGSSLTTEFANGEDFFTKAVQPLPVLGTVGGVLTHLGLSPEASTQRVHQMFSENVGSELSKTTALGKMDTQTADYMLKKLSNYAKGLKSPVNDYRLMTNKMVRNALGVDYHDAAEVQKAISTAYIKIPMAIRGMGDKAVDWTLHMPAASVIERRYLRIQGALRFSFNPFFQYLRVIPKTEILSSAEGGGVMRSIFMGRTGEMEDIRQTLRAGGFMDKSGHLGNVISGEAVSYEGETGTNLAKKLLPMQERSISGLIDAQAQRMGLDAKEYINQYPHQVADTIQAIAEYNRKSNFLNSPMARTLNIAIFPFRFDTKVVQIFAQSLARQPLLTQVAVINGVFKAHAWLNSTEGQVWYSQNAEAIGVFKYISPVAEISSAMMSLVPGHDHSLGNFGELGGLPFGWIPQILDSEGLTHFNQTGTDAATGAAIPEYVPATTKGQAAIAIQDFLGTLFSYPGAEVGLPSKTALSRNTALGLVGGSKTTDLKLETPSLDPAQQHYQQAVQTPAQQQTQTNMKPDFMAHASGTEQVPSTSNDDDLISQLKAHAAKAPKLKKSQVKPVPFPGQSALGVL